VTPHDQNEALSRPPEIIDLGRMRYRDAFALQKEWLERILAERESNPEADRRPGVILMVEHDPPVITITPRAGVNLLASPAMLAKAGIEVEETDRGGDITYHGPGQLVVYPILDLNLLKLRLHEYMRLLEATVIDTCWSYVVGAGRDPSATGVWVPQHDHETTDGPNRHISTDAKICAMGVRVRRWVSMHGLALNVTTDLSHFAHIVPCGLAGRPVTSLQRELGDKCPSMPDVKSRLVEHLLWRLSTRSTAPRRLHQRTAGT
jgi:lipoyl(octanoyl) transferase